ncbi:hypothetical protein FJK98_00695 [Micromonospora sp. HM134]|uniref:hypothetical protein n=1 Tax=unclassified Micromonospora TaxID=2617518 RepID=UPI001198AF08|nr:MULTISPECIES: hypothetical protein [unclassified Micromonospora]QDY05854.1 hypothetical protein FJK98_00695 [Micromonospora sp. HM134]
MAESAKKVARQAEERLDRVAENVREKFDRVTEGKFSDTVKDGRFADRPTPGKDREQTEAKRREQGGSQR